MPRIRTIKPEFFHDERLADLGDLPRLVYIGLWCYADREGRLEDRPRYLASQILPYNVRAFGPALEQLQRGGWVVPYAANEKTCLYLPKFLTHQRPHHTEQNSELPAPPPLDNGETTVVPPLEHGDVTDGREGKGKEGSGKGRIREGKGGAEGRSVAAPLPTPEDLIAIWMEHSPPLHALEGLSPARRQHARARLTEHPDLDYWRKVMAGVVASSFCLGMNERGWKANFDWLLRPETSQRVLEGRYANSVTVPKRTQQNLAAVDAVVRMIDEEAQRDTH